MACSKYILDEYNSNREDFMMNVLNDPSFIHQVTKLKEELDSYAEMEGGIIEILDDDIEEMMALSAPQSKGEG